MSLQSLDQNLIKSYLQQMWQKNLNTGEDPANGQHFTNGANGDNIGLYGGLSDSVGTQLSFNDSQKQYIPENIVCDSATVDNRNGLAPSSTINLSYAYTKGSSTTHSTTDSIKVGVGLDIKASATIFGVGADVTTKFTFDYTHSWGTSTTETESNTFTFSQSVPVQVPSGKVFKVVLTATSQKLIVPYTAIISVSGTTETWFEDRINGHYNWGMNAGSAFSLIGQYGIPGSQSGSYTSAGVSQSGTITASQTTNFVATTYDITDQYSPSGQNVREKVIRRVSPMAHGALTAEPVSGTVVSRVNLSQNKP